MTDDADEVFDTPETDEEITEVDIDILAEGEPEELDPEPEPEDMDIKIHRAEMEQEFAHYELNFRARRIRELTRTPVRRKSSRSDSTPGRISPI